jgi:methylmalonyl-CoA mutase cobalamin-binding domain/chain
MQDVSMKKMPDAGGGHGVKSADVAGEESQLELIKGKVNQFAAQNGRRPRVLVSHIGPSGQRRTLNQVAAMFAQRGFDVDIGSVCRSPRQVALMAIENDVHIVCLLCDSYRRSQIGRDFFDVLRAHNTEDILVAFFGDTNTDGNHRQALSGRYSPVGIRPATADADIITILDKLFKKN